MHNDDSRVTNALMTTLQMVHDVAFQTSLFNLSVTPVVHKVTSTTFLYVGCFWCKSDEDEMPPEAKMRMRNIGKYVDDCQTKSLH